tara:strand:+ start:621 stop:728 length:108 start_codon:yes stop_codon:yes gene_type:complete
MIALHCWHWNFKCPFGTMSFVLHAVQFTVAGAPAG